MNDALWRRILLRWFTSAGNRVALEVVETESAVDVTWARAEPDAAYGVHATPNWDTTVYVTDKSTTGCTINFGTAAPAGAAVDVSTFRSED